MWKKNHQLAPAQSLWVTRQCSCSERGEDVFYDLLCLTTRGFCLILYFLFFFFVQCNSQPRSSGWPRGRARCLLTSWNDPSRSHDSIHWAWPFTPNPCQRMNFNCSRSGKQRRRGKKKKKKRGSWRCTKKKKKKKKVRREWERFGDTGLFSRWKCIISSGTHGTKWVGRPGPWGFVSYVSRLDMGSASQTEVVRWVGVDAPLTLTFSNRL